MNCCFRLNQIISQISPILDACSGFYIAIGKSVILIFNMLIKMVGCRNIKFIETNKIYNCTYSCAILDYIMLTFYKVSYA